MNHISWFFLKGANMKRMGMALALGVAAVALLAGGDAWACGGGRPSYSGNGYGYGFAPPGWGPQGMPGRFAMPQSYRPMAFAPGNAYGAAPQMPPPVPMMVAQGPARPMPMAAPMAAGPMRPYGMPGYGAPAYGMPGYGGPTFGMPGYGGYGAPVPMAIRPPVMGPQGYPPMAPVPTQQLVRWPGPVGFGTAPALVSGERIYSRNLPVTAMAVPQGMPYGYGMPFYGPAMPPQTPMPYGPMAGYGYPTFGPAYPRW